MQLLVEPGTSFLRVHDVGAPAHIEGMNTFDITVLGQYVAMEIPPRCRNARRVEHDASAVVQVPIVTTKDAPVVIEEVNGEQPIAYRLHDGNLYKLSRLNHADRRAIVAGSDDYPAEINERGQWGRSAGDSPNTFATEITERYRHDIVIDDQVWTRAEEPRYVVQTFGLGSNHGGTSLHAADGDHSGIAASSYFRIDQFEQAKAYAVQVAERRGDDKSIERIRKQNPMFAYAPEALRLVVPATESELVRGCRRALENSAKDYAQSLRDGDEAKEAAAFKRLKKNRADLATLTDNITWAASEKRPYEEGRTSIWD